MRNISAKDLAHNHSWTTPSVWIQFDGSRIEIFLDFAQAFDRVLEQGLLNFKQSLTQKYLAETVDLYRWYSKVDDC